jgi:tRNA dimethylallyltransferase
MLENGAIEEVSNHKNISNSKAIGFDEICHYLDGKINKEQLIDLASQKTRNYAKRQLTWFRNKCKNAIKLSSNAY